MIVSVEDGGNDAPDELSRDGGQHLLVHVRARDKPVRDRLQLLRRRGVVGQHTPMRRLVLPDRCRRQGRDVRHRHR